MLYSNYFGSRSAGAGNIQLPKVQTWGAAHVDTDLYIKTREVQGSRSRDLRIGNDRFSNRH